MQGTDFIFPCYYTGDSESLKLAHFFFEKRIDKNSVPYTQRGKLR